MTEEISIKNRAEEELISQIKASYAASIKLAEVTRETGRAAVEKAVECGNHLISAKAAVGHGRWLDWFRNHGFDFSEQTARKYMKLAEYVNDGGSLDDAQGMRQAFIAAGILIEPTREHGTQKSHGEASKWLSYLQKGWGEIARLQESAPIKDWPVNERITLKEQIRPLAELYNSL